MSLHRPPAVQEPRSTLFVDPPGERSAIPPPEPSAPILSGPAIGPGVLPPLRAFDLFRGDGSDPAVAHSDWHLQRPARLSPTPLTSFPNSSRSRPDRRTGCHFEHAAR